MYGSTEAEPIAHVRLADSSRADLERMATGGGLLAGQPVPEIDLRIVAADPDQPLPPMTPTQFDAITQPPEAPGEIVVTGAHVLQGYLYGQGDAETKFRVGDSVRHRTGDAGYLGRDGRLWLLGRAELRIRDARGVLFPFAVELRHQPGMALPVSTAVALLAWSGQRASRGTV